MPGIRPLSELADEDEFLTYLEQVGADLPFDADVERGPSAPLSRPVDFSGLTAGNRFCVLPLEGWDADLDGRPTASTRERWRRMGAGGAKLIWAESAAVRPDGRSTPGATLGRRRHGQRPCVTPSNGGGGAPTRARRRH